MKVILAIFAGLMLANSSYALELSPKQLKEMTALKNGCKAKSSGDCLKAGVKVWNISSEPRHKDLARKLFRKSCRLGEATACEFQGAANTASIQLPSGRGIASPKK